MNDTMSDALKMNLRRCEQPPAPDAVVYRTSPGNCLPDELMSKLGWEMHLGDWLGYVEQTMRCTVTITRKEPDHDNRT